MDDANGSLEKLEYRGRNASRISHHNTSKPFQRCQSMIRHLLHMQDFADFEFDRILAYDTNTGQRRQLVMEVRLRDGHSTVNFAVFDLNENRRCILKTAVLECAIDAFNKA